MLRFSTTFLFPRWRGTHTERAQPVTLQTDQNLSHLLEISSYRANKNNLVVTEIPCFVHEFNMLVSSPWENQNLIVTIYKIRFMDLGLFKS